MFDSTTRETELRGDEIAWRPSQEYLSRSRLLGLQERAGVGNLQDLQRWAATDIGRYWDTIVQDLGLDFHRPYSSPLDLSNGKPWPVWFVDGGFNYVVNALDRHASGTRRNHLAVVWEGDDGSICKWSFRDLFLETNRLANAFTQLGVKKGDRVGIFLPMLPQTVATVLACGKIGAIFCPMFSGYGEEAVATRLRDSSAKLLVTADGFFRRGAVVPMKAVADRALASSPSVEHVIVFSRTGGDIDWATDRDHWWHELVDIQPSQAETELTAANDPYMILYTSGTTGKPKGAVHVHSGFPIKAAHDLAYCFDLWPDDNLFWFTDLGWMMGPWEIAGGLIHGSTITLFEGTPDYPDPDRLWRITERHGVTVLGLAPTAVRSLMAKDVDWVRNRDLSSLRVLGSTGETWNPGPWRWYFDEVGGGRCPVINYSGGTETGGGIVGCVTTEPIKPCAFAGPVPGMMADVVNDLGEPIRGAVGELIVREPWVGMTSGFWQDPERYLDTYWSRFEDVWVHGDWAEIDEDDFWFIRGRSDDTMKVAGKRVGPAEVESAAVAHRAVQESAAIGVPHEIKGESVIVFAVLRPGYKPGETTETEIRQEVARQLGSALRPERVIFVSDLPKTRNAKIMRRVIRAAFLGIDPGDITALENPLAVDEIRGAR